jgi:hypothetical protein
VSARAGGLVSLAYESESGFTSGATTMTSGRAFGRGQKVTNVNVRENQEVIYELGFRNANAVAYKQFEGTLGLEWIMSNPWFFKSFMGVATDSALSGGVYTHTFTKTSGAVTSLEVDVGFVASSGAITRKMLGTVLDSLTLTGSINDVVRVKANAMFYREPAIALSYGAPVVDTFAPVTFANMTLVVGVNTIAEVQSFELSLSNNIQPIFGLGSIYAVGAIPTQFDVVGRISVTMKDASWLGFLRSELTSAQLVITNGLTSNSLVTTTINMQGLNFGEHTVSYQPNQIIIENLPITVRDVTSITAQNNVAATP